MCVSYLFFGCSYIATALTLTRIAPAVFASLRYQIVRVGETGSGVQAKVSRGAGGDGRRSANF